MRVLIVNADRRVRRDLGELLALRPGISIVGAVADPESATALLETQEPDLILVDPRLPHIEAGLAFVADARRVSPARIMVLCHDGALRGRAVAAGADIFLTHGDSPSAVLAAIAEADEELHAPDSGAGRASTPGLGSAGSAPGTQPGGRPLRVREDGRGRPRR